MDEEWKHFPCQFGYYEISSFGRIRRNGNIITPSVDKDGYYKIVLRDRSGGFKSQAVHRLVAECFIGPSDGLIVNHKDGDVKNNEPTNLEYVSIRDNALHRSRKLTKLPGTRRTASGKFSSQIRIDGRIKHLGTFPTEEEAHQAYISALKAEEITSKYAERTTS